jgi:hypothetical protein
MKWGRHIDYHGSRSYDADGPAIGRFRLIAAWLANVARRKLRKPRGHEPRRSSSAILLANDERGFSWLGGTPDRNRRSGPADCPFPTNTGPSTHPGDWRVLP